MERLGQLTPTSYVYIDLGRSLRYAKQSPVRFWLSPTAVSARRIDNPFDFRRRASAILRMIAN